MMAKTYITSQGDTWDKIAYDALGSEYLLPLLLEANKQYRQIVVFPGGLTINIPDVDTAEVTERPEWLGEDEDL
jgi:phage tail protein X